MKSGLDVLGITTVYGNSTVENSTQNALTILELLNSNIPVYAGSRQPLQETGNFAQSHGDNGMGGFYVPTQRKAESEDAIMFLARNLKEPNKPMAIVAIGPLTNIARLLTNYPEATPKIGQLVIMGGVFGEDGNITKYAELNAYNDPLAFDIVLKAPVRKVIIPADVCRKVVLTKEGLKTLADCKLGKSIEKLTKVYIDYYTTDTEYGRFEGGVMYNVLTIAYLLDILSEFAAKVADIGTKYEVAGENFNAQTSHDDEYYEELNGLLEKCRSELFDTMMDYISDWVFGDACL